MPTKKEWLKEVHGIGNGKGRGRISREGHRLINEAIKAGFVFDEPFTANSNRSSKKKTVKRTPEKPVITEEYSPADVRKWASENGIEVGARGRIDSTIVQQYLDSVPKKDRAERRGSDGEKDLRDGTPRRYPEGTTFTVTFTDVHGKPREMIVSDRVACMGCKISLGHCQCAFPGPVAIGFEDTSKEVSVYVNR